ncbi:MAG: hypothetical protein ACD_84C00030G0002 [uncultured bacterium]|nr:MAG: hypothetical protein ACD_84C00030G0002 [uncultured bacterium]
MAAWIPFNQREPAWWVFHYKYQCRVRNIQTMSADYIRHFGMPTSGSPSHDAEMANELVVRMLTISEMADYFKQGVTVGVINYADTKDIYEKITDHLNAWKKVISDSFHIRGAPVEDLLLLDKFAAAVYVHAVPQFTTEIVDSLIARKMSTVLKHSRENILSPPKIKVINPASGEEEAMNKFPERLSMASHFTKDVTTGINGKWR